MLTRTAPAPSSFCLATVSVVLLVAPTIRRVPGVAFFFLVPLERK